MNDNRKEDAEYAEDLKDGDIGARQEGDLCPACGAASVRYCGLEDEVGGICPRSLCAT